MSTILEPACAAQPQAMVAQLRTDGTTDGRILCAKAKVPRHEFIPEAFLRNSDPYGEHPCSIGHDKMASQPFIVAHMTERMAVRAGEKVLEIGDGYAGRPEKAPFDVVIVTCPPVKIPGALVCQLRDGGRLSVPLWAVAQQLIILGKQGGRLIRTADLPVRFAPMIHGEEGGP